MKLVGKIDGSISFNVKLLDWIDSTFVPGCRLSMEDVGGGDEDAITCEVVEILGMLLEGG